MITGERTRAESRPAARTARFNEAPDDHGGEGLALIEPDNARGIASMRPPMITGERQTLFIGPNLKN